MKTDAIEKCIEFTWCQAQGTYADKLEKEARAELAAMREASARAESSNEKFRSDAAPGYVVLKTPPRYAGRDDEFRSAIVGAKSNEACHARRLRAMKKAEAERERLREELRMALSEVDDAQKCAEKAEAEREAARAEVERMRKPIISSKMLIQACNARMKKIKTQASEWQAFTHGFEDGAMWAQGLKCAQAAQAGKDGVR